MRGRARLTRPRRAAAAIAAAAAAALTVPSLAVPAHAAAGLTGHAQAGSALAVPAAVAAAQAAGPIKPPVAQGTLRVAGDLRDGRSVHATGLSWRPSALPRGDTLLSFEVGYAWQACRGRASGHGTGCTKAADSTATPFAARSYIAGHRDTGKYLQLTVTAAEIVETDPATFSFRAIRASAHVVTSATVAAYPRGRAPATEFVNGLPERRTGSDTEEFQVDPPHYNTADGAVTDRYRIDNGRWRAVPATGVFSTGTLRIGRHQVAVATSDHAGRAARYFSWRVTPLAAPEGCTRPAGRSCWYPPHLDATHHPMRWDWQIGLVTPRQRTGKRAVDMYDIDGFLTSGREVRQIHTRWQASTLAHPKAVCYLDLAWEDYRPDATPSTRGGYWAGTQARAATRPAGTFPAGTLGKIYYGYPEERWVDFRQVAGLMPVLNERIAMCARKGFDAVELDDIDSFDPSSTTGFHLTPGDARNFLAAAFNDVHRHGMTVLWKNTPGLSWWGVRYTDGAVVEECYIYNECFASAQRGSHQDGITCSALSGGTPCGWDDFTAAVSRNQPTGKWVGEAEYAADGYVCSPGQKCSGQHAYAAYCRAVYAPAHGFAAVKFDVDLDGKMFYPCPKGS